MNIKQVGDVEAYSQTAWRPVKPLVRAHLRKTVNKTRSFAGNLERVVVKDFADGCVDAL